MERKSGGVDALVRAVHFYDGLYGFEPISENLRKQVRIMTGNQDRCQRDKAKRLVTSPYRP